jgi:hypothetical protein
MTMACMTLLAQPVAMATTQLARSIPYEGFARWESGQNTDRQLLRMNWVVVTDNHGNQRLRMEWSASGNGAV